MLVNHDGTNPGDDLMDAFGNMEQEPTDVPEDDEGEELEADAPASDAEVDEDADLEDEADADAGDEADEDTELHTVKVGGEELKVNLQELKEGFMKDADYRRKTAGLAEDKKRLTEVETQYVSGLETLDEQLTLTATFLANQLNVDEAQLDKLATEKPAEFVALKRQMDKQGNTLQQVHNHLQRVKQERANVHNRNLTEQRKAEDVLLAEANPELRNPDNMSRLHTYLKDTFNIPKEMIDEVVDHRFLLIAEKARRFDAAKAKAALKDKQVKKAPAKFQRGGTSSRTNEAAKVQGQALKQVMRNGKVNDLAALF